MTERNYKSPASYVEIVRVVDGKSVHQPVCTLHEKPWRGAPTFDPTLAGTNLMIHRVDEHKRPTP